MTDLIYLLNNLVDLKGNILIPGINDKVLPLTDDERATYTDIDFDKVSQQQSLRRIFFSSLVCVLGLIIISASARTFLHPREVMMHVHIPRNQSESGSLYHGVQIHQSEARISPMYCIKLFGALPWRMM